MKLSPSLCASVMALAALALSANGAFAGANEPIGGSGVGLGKPCRDKNGNPCALTTAPNTGPKPCFYLKDGKPSGTVEPCPAGQSTAVNSSRSNIRNN
jgi:hypothetical protein